MISKEIYSTSNWKNYFGQKEWVLYCLFITLGIVLRWTGLADRPFHHDESLYALYGHYAFMEPSTRFYQYQPLLHGPLLFNLYPYVYQTFGVSQWSARMPMSLLGSLLTLAPFLFRNYFHKITLLFITCLFSLSPSLIYWSRFIGHDLFVFGAMVLMLYGYVLKNHQFKSCFIILGLILHFCIKENAYVTCAILLGYLIFEYFFKSLYKMEKDSLIEKMLANLKSYPLAFLGAIFFSMFIYCFLYSAGFQYPKGILDGIYRESLSYWFNQHHIERIKGPFLFNFFLLSWYDFIFILCLLVHYFHFYYRASRALLISSLSAVAISFVGYALFKSGNSSLFLVWIKTFFKLKIPLDFFGPFILISHAINVSIYHLKQKQDTSAFWGYIFFSFFFTYSFLGEKVPWLSMYVLIPGFIYLGLYFQSVFSKYPASFFREHFWNKFFLYQFIILITISLIVFQQGEFWGAIIWLVIGVLYFILYFSNRKFNYLLRYSVASTLLMIVGLFNLRMALITNFSRAGSETEFISQVHTTQVFHKMNLEIRKQILTPLSGKRPKVMVLYDPIWPAAWYFKDLPEYSIRMYPTKQSDFDFIITRSITDPELLKTHNVLAIPLRGWWVPDYELMGLQQFLEYAFHHNPWSTSGFLFVTYARKKN